MHCANGLQHNCCTLQTIIFVCLSLLENTKHMSNRENNNNYHYSNINNNHKILKQMQDLDSGFTAACSMEASNAGRVLICLVGLCARHPCQLHLAGFISSRLRKCPYCGWTKSISHHFETMITSVCWYFQGNHQQPGFLRWCRILSIHSISRARI